MKKIVGMLLACLTFAGCIVERRLYTPPPPPPVSVVENRILLKGLLQISSQFTEGLNTFQSRCSGALIHSPDLSLDSCVALTAANCFDNLPKNAMHTVEMIDSRGQIARSFPVSGISGHPDFVAADGTQTPSLAARDLALVEFSCTLPAAIQSSRLAEVSTISSTSRLFTASFEPEDAPKEETDVLGLLSFGFFKKKPAPASYRLSYGKMQFKGLETPDSEKFKSEKNSPAVVNIEPVREPCDIQSGSPLFVEHNNDLFLVGISSSGAGFCEKNKLRFTAAAHHTRWIKEALRTKEMVAVETAPDIPDVPESAPAANSSASPARGKKDDALLSAAGSLPQPSAHQKADVADFKSESLQDPDELSPQISESTPAKSNSNGKTAESKPKSRKKEKGKKTAAKSKPFSMAAKKPIPPPVADLPPQFPAADDDAEAAGFGEPADQSGSFAGKNSSSSVLRTDVPPIPSGGVLEEADQPCMGVRLVTQSKSRVWGTVINLLDKDSTQIADDSLKCEIPNGYTLCAVSAPAATGSGLSRTVLSQDIDYKGCGKFYSGKIIYLYPADFDLGQ